MKEVLIGKKKLWVLGIIKNLNIFLNNSYMSGGEVIFIIQASRLQYDVRTQK